MQGGSFGSKKAQIIPEESMFKELSSETATEIVGSLNSIKDGTNSAYESMDEYLTYLSKNGKGYITDYVKTNQNQVYITEDVIQASKNARAAQIAQNEAIKQSTISAKAGQIALKGLAMAGNMLVTALVVKGIELAATAISNYVHRVEIANEAMSDAVSANESAKSALESTTKELEEQNKKIADLQSKGTLTYVEQEELDKLKETTKQLQLQEDIENRKAEKTAKDQADKTIEAYQKQYGKNKISASDVQENLDYSKTNGRQPVSYGENDIVGNIVSLIYYTEQLNNAQERYNNALKNGEDVKYYSDDLQLCIDTVTDYKDTLDETVTDLLEKQQNLQDGYDSALAKKENGETLTTSEKDVISTYEEILNIIKLIYTYTNQPGWNNTQFNNIFDTNGIEKTKDELQEMAKEGSLTEEELKKYPKLYQAIKDADFLGDDINNVKEFINQVKAGTDAVNELKNQTSIEPQLSFTEAISQVQSLSEGFDQLKSIYEDVSNGSTFDYSSIIGNEDFTNTFSQYTDAYNDFIQTVANSPSDISACQSAFNNLAREYLNNSDALKNVTDETKASTVTMLEQMGVANAEEIVTQALTNQHANLAATKALEANSSSDLSNVTAEEITNMLNEGVITEDVSQRIAALALNKQYANQNTIYTAADCENIIRLAQVAGAGTEALSRLQRIKQQLDDNPIMADSMRNDINNRINDIISNVKSSASVSIDVPQVTYTPPVSSSSGSSGGSGSSAKDTTDHLKEAFEAEYNLLKHNLEMEYITEKDYYNGVQALNNKYYAGKVDYIDEYRKYEEEVYKGLKSVHKSNFDDEYNLLKHNLEMGKITELEYYTQLKSLNKEYFSDKKKYGDEYRQYQEEVYKGMQEYYKNYCDTQMSYYETALKSNEISVKKYAKTVSSLLKKMWKSGKISAEDYYDYVDDMLNNQKDIYDGALSAITGRIDDEISMLEYQKDQIQNQVNLLNEKNDALDLQKRKEEAIYNLEKAQAQKSKRIYIEGQGWVYKADQQAISDAQKEYNDIKTEEEIDKLQKQLDKIDKNIDHLNELKDQWSEITSIYEEQRNKLYAAQVLGANWEQKIFNSRLDALSKFRTAYLNIQHSITDNEEQQAEKNKQEADKEKAKSDAQKAREKEEKEKQSIKDYITKKADASNKAKSYYNNDPLNQYIYGKTGGKVLSMSEKKTLAGKLGLSDLAKKKKNLTKNDSKKILDALKKKDVFSKTSTMSKFAKGGVITRNIESASLVNELGGENAIVQAKEGERILTPAQNDLWERWTDAMPDLMETLNRIQPTFSMPVPDYSKQVNNIKKSMQDVNVTQNITITLPNITNEGGYDNFTRFLDGLYADSIQYSNRKN